MAVRISFILKWIYRIKIFIISFKLKMNLFDPLGFLTREYGDKNWPLQSLHISEISQKRWTRHWRLSEEGRKATEFEVQLKIQFICTGGRLKALYKVSIKNQLTPSSTIFTLARFPPPQVSSRDLRLAGRVNIVIVTTNARCSKLEAESIHWLHPVRWNSSNFI